jgi:choline dehydrogenase-like flavoprotein
VVQITISGDEELLMQLTTRQRASLELICDAFAPGADADLPTATELGVPDVVTRLVGRNPRAAERRQFATILDLWDTRLMGLVAGVGPRRFSALSSSERERMLLRLGDSRFERKRAVFQALKSAATTAYYATSGPGGANPIWERMGYPGPLGRPANPPEPALRPIRPAADETFDCDVVVIGSGAGGGTAAGVLAGAGLDVVVVERGEYYDDKDFGAGELDALTTLFAGGPSATAEGQSALVAGSCLGGGTVVNWSTSFRTPDDVREEWAGLGAKQFAHEEYDEALDSVTRRLGVNTEHSTASARDAVLQRGLERLGWHVDAMPRNVIGCDAGVECGRCGYGCRIGAKQSVAKTWLADAAARGARLVVGVDARRIEVRNGHAVGVEGVTASGTKVVVRARAVVVAAGAIQTPALLLRSGLTNRNIGRYLRLHPATAVFGVFDEEIRGWEGGMQTRYSTEHRDLDGRGYGVIYETGPVNPGAALGFLNWRGAKAQREVMLGLGHTVAVGVITRDRDGGTVSIGRDGEAIAHYRLSPYDREHMKRGIEGAAAIVEAAGARRIFSGHQAGPVYEPGTRGSLAEFVAQCHAAGYGPGQCAIAALHIMGTARMGGAPDMSAVNPDGATWDVPNIVVADGSCFPTPSGVNPMISIESIAYMNATRLAARLR